MTKRELLAGLQEENQQWEALLTQIGESRMEQPGVAGHWTIKDIVAHLTGWRRRTVGRLVAQQRGDPEPAPPWPAHLQSDDEINGWIYEQNRTRPLQEVLADSRQTFQQLVAALDGFSEQQLADPNTFVWTEGQPVQAWMFFFHFHDEHEADMRSWLAQQEQTNPRSG